MRRVLSGLVVLGAAMALAVQPASAGSNPLAVKALPNSACTLNLQFYQDRIGYTVDTWETLRPGCLATRANIVKLQILKAPNLYGGDSTTEIGRNSLSKFSVNKRDGSQYLQSWVSVYFPANRSCDKYLHRKGSTTLVRVQHWGPETGYPIASSSACRVK